MGAANGQLTAEERSALAEQLAQNGGAEAERLQGTGKPNRRERRAAAKAKPPKPPAVFSKAWLEASIQAQAQEAQQHYDLWQQSLGALALMQAQLKMLAEAEQDEPGTGKR